MAMTIQPTGGPRIPLVGTPTNPAGGSAYAPDVYYGASAPAQAQDASGTARFLGWLGGLAAGAFWAIPKLGRFGPVGFFTGLVVALACGFYGGKTVEAGQALLQAKPRPALEVGAWFAGATLAAKLISNMRQPGALLAAAVIWLGSWAADKVLGLIWPER
jgi:hypothetical protein